VCGPRAWSPTRKLASSSPVQTTREPMRASEPNAAEGATHQAREAALAVLALQLLELTE